MAGGDGGGEEKKGLQEVMGRRGLLCLYGRLSGLGGSLWICLCEDEVNWEGKGAGERAAGRGETERRRRCPPAEISDCLGLHD